MEEGGVTRPPRHREEKQEGRSREREKLNSFISPRRLEQQPPQCSVNTCTFKVLKWSVRRGADSVGKRRSVTTRAAAHLKDSRSKRERENGGFFFFLGWEGVEQMLSVGLSNPPRPPPERNNQLFRA